MINTLHLGLSYNCNMKCKHCFVDKQRDMLDMEKLKKTIDYLEENGLFFIIYTFGEPLLAKNLWEVSDYVISKGLVQTLMTNGSLINKEIIKKLKEHKINNIYVSIDSINEEKHDTNRNFKGGYKKAINALKILRDNKFNVGIAVTINDTNIKEMEEIVSLAKTLDIRNISFLRERKNSKLLKLEFLDLYQEFYKKYLSNKKEINILFHDPSLLNITKELYDKKIIDQTTYEKYLDMNSCHYYTTLSIEPNGNVKNCNLINRKKGNINEEDIKEIITRGCDKNECTSYCTELSK